jgi:hypothetical protein
MEKLPAFQQFSLVAVQLVHFHAAVQFTVSVIQRALDDIITLILCRPHITETQTGTTLIPEVGTANCI